MEAGINQMVARQSKMGIKNQNTELKHTHINLAVLIRHSLKYKNTVSQKTSYRDTELQIKENISGLQRFQREERQPGWKKKGEEAGEGEWKGWPYRRLLPPTDTWALWDFPLGLQRREDWNSALPEIRPDQNQNSSSLPRGGDQSPILSSGWGPFDQIHASRTGRLEKQGRTGGVKERKERGKGREGNKSLLFLTGQGTLASFCTSLSKFLFP